MLYSVQERELVRGSEVRDGEGSGRDDDEATKRFWTVKAKEGSGAQGRKVLPLVTYGFYALRMREWPEVRKASWKSELSLSGVLSCQGSEGKCWQCYVTSQTSSSPSLWRVSQLCAAKSVEAKAHPPFGWKPKT
ncbi:hypothetical protein M378DRAFT_165662, partial [Amanita muscaria Koide BX008]